MDPREEEQLQPSRCRQQTHYSGLPKMLGRHLVVNRQRWNVELEIVDR